LRRYRSPIVQKLISENPNFDRPEEVIGQKVKDLHELYFYLQDVETFPINMEILASIAGVKVTKMLMSDGISGQLVPTKEGMIAQINILDPENRQNFTIGHEVGHTFFPGFTKKKFRAEREKIFWGERINIEDEEECLCDYAASELLIPTSYFIDQINQLGFSVSNIPKLSTYFGASYEAVAIKMVNIADFPCAILISEKGLKPSEQKQMENERLQLSFFETPKFEEKLRVKYAARSSSWQFGYIPSSASIPENSSIYKAAKMCEIITTKEENLEIKKFSGVFDLETFPLDYFDENGNSTKTFTLIS
jgi:Zn-dependent peptidase ImmA (M78 family)